MEMHGLHHLLGACHFLPRYEPSLVRLYPVSIRKYCLPLVVFLAARALLAQTTLLNDDFSTAGSPGDLATVGPQGAQNTPSSAEWFLIDTPNGSATYTNPTLAPPGSLTQTFSVDQAVVAYFENPGAQQQLLTIGDSIGLSVDFTISGATTSPNGIGFALYDSGSTGLNNFQLTANNTGTTNSDFTNYSGVVAFINPNSTSNTTVLSSRAAGVGNSDLFAAGYGLIDNSASGTDTLNGSYHAKFTLTYAGAGSLVLAFVIKDSSNNVVTDYTASGTAASLPTQFDTIVINGVSGVATSLALTNVNVTFQAVPEPPVYALCAGGLAVLAAASWWSRRRAARMTA